MVQEEGFTDFGTAQLPPIHPRDIEEEEEEETEEQAGGGGG